MKKILLGGLILGMVGCNSDKVKTKTELYSSVSKISSSNFSNKIKLYIITHPGKELEFKTLDSIQEVSNKSTDSIIMNVVKKVYE
jgi:hypothetical protein